MNVIGLSVANTTTESPSSSPVRSASPGVIVVPVPVFVAVSESSMVASDLKWRTIMFFGRDATPQLSVIAAPAAITSVTMTENAPPQMVTPPGSCCDTFVAVFAPIPVSEVGSESSDV